MKKNIISGLILFQMIQAHAQMDQKVQQLDSVQVTANRTKQSISKTGKNMNCWQPLLLTEQFGLWGCSSALWLITYHSRFAHCTFPSVLQAAAKKNNAAASRLRELHEQIAKLESSQAQFAQQASLEVWSMDIDSPEQGRIRGKKYTQCSGTQRFGLGALRL